jgi:hypothetical protein
VAESVDAHVSVAPLVHSGRLPTDTMIPWYLASGVPFGSVSESVAAVIGV